MRNLISNRRIIIISVLFIFGLILIILLFLPSLKTEEWFIELRTEEGEDRFRESALEIDSLDNIYVLYSLGKNIYLLKYDQLNTLIWNITVFESPYAYPNVRDLSLDSQNNIYVLVTNWWGGYIFLSKYNNEGDLLWNKNFEDFYLAHIAIDSNDNIYLTSQNSYQIKLFKYDQEGNHLWNVTWSGGYTPNSGCIALDSVDNVYIGGYNNFGLILIKYNASGIQLWNITKPYNFECNEMGIDSENNIYLLYQKTSQVNFMKYNSSGIQLWNITLDFVSQKLIIDLVDNILITGSLENKMIYVKYDNIGNELNRTIWDKGDIAFDLALDSSGNIYLIGLSGSEYDYSYKYYFGNLCIVKNPITINTLALSLLIILITSLITGLISICAYLYVKNKKQEIVLAKKRSETRKQIAQQAKGVLMSSAKDREFDKRLKLILIFIFGTFAIFIIHVWLLSTPKLDYFEDSLLLSLLISIIGWWSVCAFYYIFSAFQFKEQVNLAKKKIETQKQNAKQSKIAEIQVLIETGERQLISKSSDASGTFLKGIMIVNNSSDLDKKEKTDLLVTLKKHFKSAKQQYVKDMMTECISLINEGKKSKSSNNQNNALKLFLKALELTNKIKESYNNDSVDGHVKFDIDESWNGIIDFSEFDTNEPQLLKKIIREIKSNIDDIHQERIKFLIEQGKNLNITKKFNNAVSKFEDALEISAKILDSKRRNTITKEVKNHINSVLTNLIESEINRAQECIAKLELDRAIISFKNTLSITSKMYESKGKSSYIKKIERFLYEVRISKIKNTILDLGLKFGRLQVVEIAEECSESKDLIITTIKEMVEAEEIFAKYFESSQSVAFDQLAIKNNLDKLRDSINPAIIPEAPKMCTVCRGKITSLLVECTKCGALYHLKCAKALKNKEEGCFQCHTKFPPLPELPPEEEQEDPVIISIRKLGYQTASLLNPEDIRHKDLSAEFIQLKKNLQEELRHKVSSQFHDSFKSQIEDLFTKISQLSAENLGNLDAIRKEQKKIFMDINKKLTELQDAQDEKRWIDSLTKKKRIFCPECGNEITEENQTICEECGLDLKDKM